MIDYYFKFKFVSLVSKIHEIIFIIWQSEHMSASDRIKKYTQQFQFFIYFNFIKTRDSIYISNLELRSFLFLITIKCWMTDECVSPAPAGLFQRALKKVLTVGVFLKNIRMENFLPLKEESNTTNTVFLKRLPYMWVINL